MIQEAIWNCECAKKGGCSIDYLEMTDMDFNNLWEEISDQRVLFQPTIAPDDEFRLPTFISIIWREKP